MAPIHTNGNPTGPLGGTPDGGEWDQVNVNNTKVWPTEQEVDYFNWSTRQDFFDAYINPSSSSGKGPLSLGTDAVEGGVVWQNTQHAYDWSVPSQGTLPNYPEAGTRFIVHTRLEQMPTDAQIWYIFGGQNSTIYSGRGRGSYQLEMHANQGVYRVRYTDSNGNSHQVASNEGGVSWNTGVWYCHVIDWFDQNIDGRTGVRVRLYQGEMVDPDDTSLSPVEDIDSANYPTDDASGTIPQGLGAHGVRCGGNGGEVLWDAAVKYGER